VSFELLWSTADSAMYGAKRGGGDRVGVAAVRPPEELPVETGDPG
jgi:hypothetical protein